MSNVESYLSADYQAKSDAYYAAARTDYIELLPENAAAAILEVGCGNGATGALALRLGRCAQYVGVEMFAPAAAEAETVLTRVHLGNVETMELPYETGTFDALIMSEVLEHLVDPEAILRRLAPMLKPGARVFASSPNIAQWRIIRGLITGKFIYAEAGVMDRTHLRWFTPRTFRKMFEDAGVIVDSISPLEGGVKRRILGALLGPFRHLLWVQINLHGRKAA